MRTACAEITVPLGAEGSVSLWTDVGRWPTFVEGFARTLEVSDDWPARGARVVWESRPGGRGRVTERVVENRSGGTAERRFATDVFESALHGTQRATFAPAREGTRVDLELEYELEHYGPLRAVADALFVRRALRDALRRTLHRFAVEAEEAAGLR